jgi:serine/threonine-protein kinase
VLEVLGKGGQGTSYLTERLGVDGEPGKKYVLKILNSQGDPDRRARMFREVAALETLNHPGIPKVVETNADEYKDQQQALYLVTEFIPGPTLEQHIDRSPIDLAQAVQLLFRLAEIVHFCHERGVVHRDIKPDNVLLKSGALAEPVLLDFGLSFNESAQEDTTLTASAQQLGNRFLALPELQNKSSNRRDPRSDVAQLCGILLYVLTTEYPVTLLDDQSRMPHQRPASASILASFTPEVRSRLNRLFDTGFMVSIDRRFQSVEMFRDRLSLLTQTIEQGGPGGIEDQFALLRQQLTATSLDEKWQYHSLFEAVDKILVRACVGIRDKFEGRVQTIQSDCQISTHEMKYKNSLGLYVVADSTQQFFPQFEAVIAGSELVVTARHVRSETELFRTPIAGANDWDRLLNSATAYLVKGLVHECSGF